MAVVLRMPDGGFREVDPATAPLDLAGAVPGAVVARVGERLVDLGRPFGELVPPDQPVAFTLVTVRDPEGLAVYRHTATHVMAQAVRRLYPGTRLATGPATEDGFFYDLDVRRADGTPVTLTQDDLPAIEEEMRRIVAADYPIRREVWDREQARRHFAERGEVYKVEILDGLPPDAEVTVYRQGEFYDLCRGPHLPSTGCLKAFKLLSVAGAYWRGDERRPMLQRLYGTAFPDEEALRHHLWVLEEARRRDHRRLGPELGLFLLRDEAPGFPFWLPKGWVVYRTLEEWSRELQRAAGYQEVQTPVLMRGTLWERSGHWAHYRENMFVLDLDGQAFALKPMNCPAHCLLFASATRSYRDLPLRFSEYQQLARYERSGTLHGLLRARGMHQDDAHLFVAPEQVESEIVAILGLVDRVYGVLGLPYEVRLATRPEDALGDPSRWAEAEAALARALERTGRSYAVSPGEGAFYGPKLEFHVADALGRRWQCATVQLDFNLPERFDLWYVGPDGARHRPVLIHRAVFGSMERFLGMLLEHFAGAFPTWLAPVQVVVLPVADRHRAYAQGVRNALEAAGVRATVDDRDEKVGYRVRQAELDRVPYVLVVGDREAGSEEVAVRSRRSGDLGREPLARFVASLVEEIRDRRLEPR
jgi:threonyl-tRNA synthetase